MMICLIVSAIKRKAKYYRYYKTKIVSVGKSDQSRTHIILPSAPFVFPLGDGGGLEPVMAMPAHLYPMPLYIAYV